ncbi:hypothetical protein [Desertivirga arenae]|uniref:hypothetical protein n=1 Tax=Desertivirga arenae TaxID=2810309 RepID=UPI001A971B66|nr:hypothetical protein [Pedobacter sp. SYSU D00823]
MRAIDVKNQILIGLFFTTLKHYKPNNNQDLTDKDQVIHLIEGKTGAFPNNSST